MNAEKVIKRISKLDKKEGPTELLKIALVKKKIIPSINAISDEEVDELFKILDKKIND